MRRITCHVLATLLAGLAAADALAEGRIEGAPLAVDGGAVTGNWAANGHVRAYLGIPFAAPPVGELRWKPPQPVTPWQGVRAAMSFGPQCLQAGGSPKSVYFEYSGGDLPISEDCLTLNVWAPAEAKDLPVMVWIYGGGFQVGSASWAFWPIPSSAPNRRSTRRAITACSTRPRRCNGSRRTSQPSAATPTTSRSSASRPALQASFT